MRLIIRSKSKMSVSSYVIVFLLSLVIGRPVPQTRDVKALGPGGTLDLEQRWADTVGTATQVWMNGAARKNSVLHTSPIGPISEVYRNVLRRVHQPSKTGDGFKREIAINGFGGVGEVQYGFKDGIENVQGRSTQVLVACRCVGRECRTAVLIRPVNVFQHLPQGANETLVRRTCLYEAVGNGFSDCHAELLRSVRRPIGQRPEYTHGSDAFVYTVDEPSSQLYWTAQGQRGWTRDCLLSDVNSLPKVTIKDLAQVQKNMHSTPADNGCKPPDSLVQYFEEADEAAGEACYETYEYASAAASQLGSQHDWFAIGLKQRTYIDSKPSLVSDTELALTCSAAGLGLLVLWGFYRTRRENVNRAGFFLLRVVTIQVLSYALESLPLHIALLQETFARDWESEFAHVGGSVALGSDQLVPQGSAEGSVLVMTAVFGTVKYQLTRVSLVAWFTVAFDLFAFGIIAATLLTRRRPRSQAGMPQPPRPVCRLHRWMRHIRRYLSRESQESERKRREMEAIQQQQLHNIGRHVMTGNGWVSNALVGMSSESTTMHSATSATASDAPEDMDIGADAVPTIGHNTYGTDVAVASPPEQTIADVDVSHTPRGGNGAG